MKSAFGIKLHQQGTRDWWHGAEINRGKVQFEKLDDGRWVGFVEVYGFEVYESFGSASMEACYRSLRGRVKNLRNELSKLLGER